MATLRQYFETDFSHVVRVSVKVSTPDGEEIDSYWLVDFLGYIAYLSCYVPCEGRSLEFFQQLVKSVEYGKARLAFQHKIVLPASRQFPGVIKIEKDPLVVKAQFFGDPGEVSTSTVQMSTRLFIYSETQLSEEDVISLKREALNNGQEVQFRSTEYVRARSKQQVPLAFISYDSRDRDVAQRIAIGLQRLMCPVWYDEFSLKVGDNLFTR
jgi:hypothetical protein